MEKILGSYTSNSTTFIKEIQYIIHFIISPFIVYKIYSLRNTGNKLESMQTRFINLNAVHPVGVEVIPIYKPQWDYNVPGGHSS